LREKNFVKSATLLAASTIIAKFIGACYRIPLNNILGPEGMGLYQLVFPVFSLLLTLSSGAIPSAMSIMISQKRAMGENTKKFFFTCLITLSVIGFLVSFLLILFAEQIAALQANPMSYTGYLVIAPSIFFVSVMAVFRGYYMGVKNMVPPAISQISEGVIKLVAGLFFARYFIIRGLEFGVMGALLGVTISEIVTLIILFVMYREKESIKNYATIDEMRTNLKDLFRIAAPLTLGGIILPLSLFLDSIVIINVLKINQSVSSATLDYGLLSGTVAPIINLPIMLTLTLGIAVVPMISEERISRDLEGIKQKITMCVKLALTVGAPFSLLYIFLAENILSLLYPGLSAAQLATASTIMRIESFNIIFLSLGQIYSSLLQALGRVKQPVTILFVCVVIKTALSVVLMRFFGIAGAALASLSAFLINAIFNIIIMQNLIGKVPQIVKDTSLIAISGAILSMVVFGMSFLLSDYWAIFVILPISGLAYIIALLAIGVFSQSELKSLPLSTIWIKIDKIFRRNKNAVT
jgi:stage V sporulation protein B